VIVALAAVTAIAAAIRGTWSPCGLSMLSTITPLAEQSRGYRYRTTAAWFVAGAVLGGCTMGLGAAALALLAGAVGLSVAATLTIAALAALVTAASDLRLFGWQLPIHPRQVNEVWLSSYRAWVYGGGFGWQIGTGFATYIMTAAVYLTVALAALTGSPLVALAIGALFGLVRGLAILLGARITSTERLVAFHRRFDALAEPVRRAVIGVQLGVAAVALVAVWAPASLLVIAVAVTALALTAAFAATSRRPSAAAN
jgi:hypothetical protein